MNKFTTLTYKQVQVHLINNFNQYRVPDMGTQHPGEVWGGGSVPKTLNMIP